MNTGERERMRLAVSRAVASGRFPESAARHPGRFAHPAGDREPVPAVDDFTREVESLAGRVYRAADLAAATSVVRRLAADMGARGVLAWSGHDLVDEVTLALERDGAARIAQAVPLAGVERATSLAVAGGCELGVTGADYALADTGSLVLSCGAGRGRLASLLPPVHVALVRADRVVASLAHALADDPGLATRGSNLVVITGPSRTADIEMTLSRGVHGPRELHVVVIG